MKKVIFALALVAGIFAVALQASAQDKKEQPKCEEPEQTPGQRMASRLMLDDKTSAKFVTLYDEYAKAKKELCCDSTKKGKCPSELTDDEAKTLFTESLAARRAAIDLEEQYYKKFLEILTPKQALSLFTHAGGPGREGGRPGPGAHQGGPKAPHQGQMGPGEGPGAPCPGQECGPQGKKCGEDQGQQCCGAPQGAPQGQPKADCCGGEAKAPAQGEEK